MSFESSVLISPFLRQLAVKLKASSTSFGIFVGGGVHG